MPADYDITDAINASAKQQFTTLTQQLAMTTSSATSNALAPGKYRVVATASCYILQGASTVTLANTAVGIYFPGDFPDEITVDSQTDNGYIAAIMASGSGTLCISPK